jgi:glycosyltransferase involved in cell wall biosynthesis
MPLISVIMPVYNAATYLREAMDSILTQTFGDLEFIIVNDGSTDDSAKIIRSYNDPRIRCLDNGKNRGLVFSLNRAVNESTGTYIARMDSDDISEPERFSVQLSYFKNDPSLQFICSPILGITPDGKIRDHWPTDINNLTPEQIRRTLPRENCISHPTVMIRRELLEKYKYSEAQAGSEDWDLWLRMIRDGVRIKKTREVLLRYRIHPGSATQLYKKRVPLRLKTAAVKIKFALGSVTRPRINGVVGAALLSGIRDVAAHFMKNIIPGLLKNVKWLFSIDPLKAWKAYRHLLAALDTHKSKVFLFFPYYHIGGAEKVHALISEAVEPEKPFIFFTGLHNQYDHSSQFPKSCPLLKVAPALYHPLFSARAMKRIVSRINSTPGAKLLGCNSRFYESLVLKIDPAVFTADLTHDIAYEPGQAEQAQLWPVLRLNKRVFISNRALERTRAFYEANFLDAEYFSRLSLIYNGIHIPDQLFMRQWSAPFTILYAGRDTPEKRVDMIFELAEKCASGSMPFKFEFAGEIKPPANKPGNTIFHGKILDANEMSRLYSKAHFVIISSSSEGFPLAIMEGMAEGCIPLSTPVGDIPFHIKNNKNGFLTTNADRKEAISEFHEILRNIAAGEFPLSLISEECRAYSRDTFSIEKFRLAYRELLAG